MEEKELEKGNQKEKRVGRWAPKEYSKELIEKIKSSLHDDEVDIYKALFSNLSQDYELDNHRDLLLLDLAIKDFLRTQRIHKVLKEEGDFVHVMNQKGQEYTKAHEAGFLLNAVSTQLRNNLKELGLTKKESDRKKIEEMGKTGDFAEFLYVEAKDDEKPKSNDKKATNSSNKKT